MTLTVFLFNTYKTITSAKVIRSRSLTLSRLLLGEKQRYPLVKNDGILRQMLWSLIWQNSYFTPLTKQFVTSQTRSGTRWNFKPNGNCISYLIQTPRLANTPEPELSQLTAKVKALQWDDRPETNHANISQKLQFSGNQSP